MPQKTAFKIEREGKVAEVTFAAFKEDIDNLVSKVMGHGGSCAAVVCDGSYSCILNIMALCRAGYQTVLLDASLSEEELLELMDATDVDFVLGDEDLEELLREKNGEISDSSSGDGSAGPTRILFFTSGTTEHSKAVVLTESTLCSSAYNGSYLLPLSEDDTLLCLLPLNHVFGFVCGFLWGFSGGSCVALGRGMRHLIDDLSFFKPTAVSVVPQLLGFLLKNNLINTELSLVLIGAGDCPPEIIRGARERGLKVSFGYGLTETSSGVALSLGEDPYLMTICPDFEVAISEDGEVLIGNTTCMMAGYYNDPADTAAALSDGVLHTGDLGVLEDGKLRITGRKKEILVLSDGTKIFLPEYERALAKRLPGRDFAVTGVDGSPYLFVYNANKDCDNGLDAAHIGRSIETFMMKLPRGQQIKKICVINNPLPRTATGKIKRWELKEGRRY